MKKKHKENLFLGIDIGGTTIKAGVINCSIEINSIEIITRKSIPTNTAIDSFEFAQSLIDFIKNVVKKRGKEFITFFNESGAINKRIHQIELLPGLGKKHMQEILKQREEKNFESFEDMKKRIQNLPDPERAVEKRIFQELTNLERYNLFTGAR